MTDALVLWIHILAATMFVGPQIFLAAVAVPALRGLDDVRTRQQALRSVTRGFGWLGGGALAVLLATGIYNYYEFELYIDRDLFPRYFFVLMTKLTLVTIVVGLTALHAGLLGRRLQQLQEQGAPEAEIRRWRGYSMATSMATLAASLAILLCAALLRSDWSKLS